MLYLINQFTPAMLNLWIGTSYEVLIQRIDEEEAMNLLSHDSPFTQKAYVNCIEDDRINRYLFEQLQVVKPQT